MVRFYYKCNCSSAISCKLCNRFGKSDQLGASLSKASFWVFGRSYFLLKDCFDSKTPQQIPRFCEYSGRKRTCLWSAHQNHHRWIANMLCDGISESLSMNNVIEVLLLIFVTFVTRGKGCFWTELSRERQFIVRMVSGIFGR